MDFPQQDDCPQRRDRCSCGHDIRIGKLEQAEADTLHGKSCNPLDCRGLLRPRAEQQQTATNSRGACDRQSYSANMPSGGAPADWGGQHSSCRSRARMIPLSVSRTDGIAPAPWDYVRQRFQRPHARIHRLFGASNPGLALLKGLSGRSGCIDDRPIDRADIIFLLNLGNLGRSIGCCENCHWPQKFGGVRLRVFSKYADDEANTRSETVLLMLVGGNRIVRNSRRALWSRSSHPFCGGRREAADHSVGRIPEYEHGRGPSLCHSRRAAGFGQGTSTIRNGMRGLS